MENNNLHKKSIILKTMQVGGSTLVSRALALVRTALELKFFGAGSLSDAWNSAYAIPNRLRKVFAEGAISAAFIPDLIKIVKEKEYDQANKLMTLTLLVIESVVIAICLLVVLKAKQVLLFIAPGFKYKTYELENAIPILRVLIFFIFFVSSSALLAGAMQARHYFLVPSWGPVLLNVAYIVGLIISIKYNLCLNHLALFIILGGMLVLGLNIYTYLKIGFRFSMPDKITWKKFGKVMGKFLPCIFTMSAVEINLTIDNMLASFLQSGSITLFYYATGFFRIPLGVFATAFSTILLSHFSRVSTYAPKRLSFYLLESSKFVFWITIPVTIVMSIFSYDLFYTLAMLSGKLTLLQANEAASTLQALILSLFFVSINKILLSMYYSLHSTFLPTFIALMATITNTVLNLILVPYMGIMGLALATSIGEITKTFLFIYILYKRFNFALYIKNFLNFAALYLIQTLFVGSIIYIIYTCILKLFSYLFPVYAIFFTKGFGFWLISGIFALVFFGLLYITRKKFKIKAYFLD